MKTITDKEYWETTHCSGTFNIYSLTLTQVQEFLNRKGYDIIIHRAEQKNTEVRQSDGYSGSTERVGYFDMMVERVLAVKPGTVLPTEFTEDVLNEMGLNSVFQREICKNILA